VLIPVSWQSAGRWRCHKPRYFERNDPLHVQASEIKCFFRGCTFFGVKRICTLLRKLQRKMFL